jgi:hypothetical protein
MQRYGRLTLGVGIAVAVLAVPSSAAAATQIGQTFSPTTNCGSFTFIEASSPTGQPQYTIPSSGVITSWSYESLGSFLPTGLKLKVARPAGGSNFTIVGDSAPQNPVASTVNTYPARVSVEAGDVIGFYVGSGGFCSRGVSGYFAYDVAGDPPPGSTVNFPFTLSNYQFDLAATLEPDADNDGFGDETQDCAPNDPSRHDDCSPPDTTITKGPKNKTKKKAATFEFTANEPGATFECSLDGGAFAPCTSPDTIKVKKGKHTFAVRAKDAAGNADGSPASDDWKVKKKKK